MYKLYTYFFFRQIFRNSKSVKSLIFLFSKNKIKNDTNYKYNIVFLICIFKINKILFVHIFRIYQNFKNCIIIFFCRKNEFLTLSFIHLSFFFRHRVMNTDYVIACIVIRRYQFTTHFQKALVKKRTEYFQFQIHISN